MILKMRVDMGAIYNLRKINRQTKNFKNLEHSVLDFKKTKKEINEW